MEIKRTPDKYFLDLPGYNFEPNYLMTDGGLRMHYVDAGDEAAESVVLLHGEPSWSYLYRKMIPVFTAAGYRVVVPDLIGFGKSDKPADLASYSYENHLKWLEPIFSNLGLVKINLFLQDWGGLLGFRLMHKYDHLVDRLVLANTLLPTGHIKPNEAFLQWRDFSQNVPVFDAGKILNMATVGNLDQTVINAYNAPYPDETYKAGARIFPMLVPIEFDDPQSVKNRECLEYLKRFEKPCLTLFSDSDPIMAGGEKYFQRIIPGCAGKAHEIISAAGHFLQEDKGEEIAVKMLNFMKAN